MPSTKTFIKELSEEESVLCETLVGAHLGGSHKGTYVHLLFVIHADLHANPRFVIACHKALLRCASTSGKVVENGDVALRLDAEPMEEASA